MKKPVIVIMKKGKGIKVYFEGETFEISKDDILN